MVLLIYLRDVIGVVSREDIKSIAVRARCKLDRGHIGFSGLRSTKECLELRWLRVAGAPPGTVYGLGDAFCCIPNGESEPVPQTAQVAGCVEIEFQAPHAIEQPNSLVDLCTCRRSYPLSRPCTG